MPSSKSFDIDKAKWKKAEDVYMAPNEGRANDLVIPVMGSAGAGKSTFINNVLKGLGSGLQGAEVSDKYQPCTSKVAHYVVDCLPSGSPDLPQLQSRRLVLVDTPAFDHTDFSKEEILRRISVWLASSYGNGIKVAGVVYLHSIAEGRYTNSHVSEFEIFQSICGQDVLPSVVLATTREGICSVAQRSEREGELRDELWKGMLDGHPKATMTSLQNTPPSALAVVKIVFEKMNGTPLLLQRQIVDDKKSYTKTDAGRAAKPQSGSGFSGVVTIFRQFIRGL